MSSRLYRPAGMFVVAIALASIVGWPLYELIRAALDTGGDGLLAALQSDRLWSAVVNSLWTGALVAVVSVVIGTVAALLVDRATRPGVLRAGLLMPLIIPPFVSALGWARAYGPTGLMDDLFGLQFDGVFGPVGVVLVIVVNTVPLAFLVISAGLVSRNEPDLVRAARAAGAGVIEELRTITLPLLRPALVAAGGLTFVVAINSFGVPILLGTPAGFSTMTTQLYQDLALSSDVAAFTRVIALAIILVIVALVVVMTTDGLSALGGMVRRTASPHGLVHEGGSTRGSNAIIWCYVAATSLVPLVALILTALTRAVGLPATPSNWTLDWFRAVLGGSGGPLWHSFSLAVLTAVIVVGLGGLVAGISRGRGLLGGTVLATFAVPGSALAVGVLLAYGVQLRGTLTLILLAYLAKFWALGHRTIAGSLDSLPPDLVLAARSSGAGPGTTLRTVVVPLLSPAVSAAALLVFLFAFHELTMSALLYGPGTETLAVVVLNLRQLGDVALTSAIAVMITAILAIGAGPLLVARRAVAKLSSSR